MVADVDESACIAVTFITAAVVVVPVTLAVAYAQSGLIAAPILVFLWQSQKGSSDRSAIQEMDMKPSMSVSDPV
jgi:hypothetical protein